jgi:hypothetical protein
VFNKASYIPPTLNQGTNPPNAEPTFRMDVYLKSSTTLNGGSQHSDSSLQRIYHILLVLHIYILAPLILFIAGKLEPS